MTQLRQDLSNMKEFFAAKLPAAQVAGAQTAFLKKLSELTHSHFRGKMQTVPKAGIWGFNWFNVWYTPGVSSVSTAIRDLPARSWDSATAATLWRWFRTAPECWEMAIAVPPADLA